MSKPFPLDAVQRLIAALNSGDIIGHIADILSCAAELYAWFLPSTDGGQVQVFGANELSEDQVHALRELGLALGIENEHIMAADPVTVGPLVSSLIATVLAALAGRIQDPALWAEIIKQIRDRLFPAQ